MSKWVSHECEHIGSTSGWPRGSVQRQASQPRQRHCVQLSSPQPGTHCSEARCSSPGWRDAHRRGGFHVGAFRVRQNGMPRSTGAVRGWATGRGPSPWHTHTRPRRVPRPRASSRRP
eukprot:5077292-Prymnesium_polylepis.2